VVPQNLSNGRMKKFKSGKNWGLVIPSPFVYFKRQSADFILIKIIDT
jgi:hypothetical protein